MSDIIPQDSPRNNLTPETTFIYTLSSPLTPEEVRYVGKANNPQKRLIDHIREKKDYRKNRWLRDLKSQGLEPAMQVIEEVPYELWPERECFWIAYYKDQGCHLTNSSEGGIGGNGAVRSLEARAKISAARKGKSVGPRPKSEEHRRKQSATMKGRKQSAEQIAKAATARTGLKRSPETKAKIAAALLGKKHTEERKAHMSEVQLKAMNRPETRSKMAAAQRGKKLSPETKAKVAAANLGRKHSPEAIAKISEAKAGKKREPFSEEWRKKLGDASRGKKRPPEVAEKIKGRKHSPEAIAKMSLARQQYWAMKKSPPFDAPSLWD